MRPSTAPRARQWGLRSLAALVLVGAALAGCSTDVETRPAPPTVVTPRVPSSTATDSPAPTPTSPPTPGVDRGIAPGTSGMIKLDNRPFELYVGRGYRSSTPTALLISLHGYTADGRSGFAFLGLRRVADERGLLVALPDGTEDKGGDRFWNASRVCCDFWGTKVNDSRYLSRLITEVSRQYAIAPRAVVVLGHSNGGFMAHRMACDHADQVSAVVSVAGALDVGGKCKPSQPVSVLQVHGTDDQTVRYRGGEIDENRYTATKDTVAKWRKLDGCKGQGVAGEGLNLDEGIGGDDVTPLDWTGCRNGSGVSLWAIEGGSHSPALTRDFGDLVMNWVQDRS